MILVNRQRAILALDWLDRISGRLLGLRLPRAAQQQFLFGAYLRGPLWKFLGSLSLILAFFFKR